MIDYSFLLTPTSLPNFESAKARKARAAFTTPVVSAPWDNKSAIAQTLLSKAAEAKRIRNFVEPVTTINGRGVGDVDLESSFTVFKALDRLNALAKMAAEKGISSTERASLDKSFQMGMGQLQEFLASAPTDKLSFSFTKPTSTVETVKVPSPYMASKGSGVLEVRSDPVEGLSGDEILRINLSKGGQSDSVDINLSEITGPLTLDAIAEAANTAISSIPLMRDGDIVRDSEGNQVSRYITRVKVEKHGDKWGFAFSTVETEKVSLQEATAGNALIVASAQTPLEGIPASRIEKITDPTGEMSRLSLGTISAIDRDGTLLAGLTKDKTVKVEGVTPPSTDVYASTTVKAVAVNNDGYSFVVGTTEGDIGENRGTGSSDLFLTKLDSEGKIVWQRQLGAFGESEGNAVAVDSHGNVVVTGSTTAAISDGDVFSGRDAFVAKFNAAGDELFVTQIDGLSDTSGTALAIDDEGNIYMGGNVSGHLSGMTGNGGQDAILIKLSATGQVTDRVQFGDLGRDALTALALHPDGSLLVGSTEDGQAVLRQFDAASMSNIGTPTILGAGSISSIAVDEGSGAIAIGGTTTTGLAAGTPTNAVSGSNDGFVAQIGADLSVGAVTYVGTTATDTIDSLTYMDGVLYAGGRTNEVLGDSRTGAMDSYVARFNSDGSLAHVHQYGARTATSGPVVIAASKGGDTMLSKLGLQQGDISQAPSDKLVSQTTLRPGDSFSIKVGNHRNVNIAIEADDTFETLASRIRLATGYRVNLTLSKLSTGWSMKFAAKADQPIELTAGPDGQDALSKLGLSPVKLALPKVEKDGVAVSPGGSFSLELKSVYSIKDQESAGYVVKMLENAISIVQSGYRSLYWDDTKAMLADGALGSNLGGGTPYQQAQIANYQAALARLGG